MRSVVLKINLPEKHTSCIAIIAVCLCVVFFGSETVFQETLTIDSIFAGMLALTGFLFTARTFVTFKLHESVYGDDKYRIAWKEMKQTGGFASGCVGKQLYEPLRQFDAKVGEATKLCFINLILILAFSFVPAWFGEEGKSFYSLWQSAPTFTEFLLHDTKVKIYEVICWVVLSGIVLVLVNSFYAFLSINRNIQRIIDFWETEYANNEPKPKS